MIHHDEHENPIAWTETGEFCENPGCHVALSDGRPVHIIPHHLDPRAQEWTLALPSYHFKTVSEALIALELAWQFGREVHTAEERDRAYAAGVPVKIDKKGVYVDADVAGSRTEHPA